MLKIKPIVVRKAAEVLANELREKILSSALTEGYVLPTERDLAAQTGLSRASVREALRILEVEGLIATRTGRNGGSEVIRPDISTIERSVGIFIRGQRVRLEAVLEAREAIEPQAARLAAMHHTSDDWADLQRRHQHLLDVIEGPGDYFQANLDWHMSVVRAGHNELLIAFVSAFAPSVYAYSAMERVNTGEHRRTVAQAHRRVMDAIAARDADAAGRRMARHVGAYVAEAQPLTSSAR